MATAGEYRAAGIVADILKMIPTLAFGEIVGVIAYVGEKTVASGLSLLSVAVAALVISALSGILGLSFFVGPLSDDRTPINNRSVRICTMVSFYSLVAGSVLSAYVVLAQLWQG